MDEVALVAVTDEGEEAVSQGDGASRSWRRLETVLPGASGRPGPVTLRESVSGFHEQSVR